MTRINIHWILALVVAVGLFFITGSGVIAQEPADPEAKPEGLQQRIDFSSSHILGQSIKSGAVYLMHRKQSDISSMLKVRQDYRQEIMEDFALEDSALIAGSDSKDPDATVATVDAALTPITASGKTGQTVSAQRARKKPPQRIKK